MIQTLSSPDIGETSGDDRASLGASILGYAEYVLASEFRIAANESSTEFHLFEEPPAGRLNVTLRTNGRLRGSMSGTGGTLAAQIRSAVINAARDKRFSSRLSLNDLPSTSIEVWVQVAATPVPLDERESRNFITLGKQGVEVHCDGRSAYFKPSVAITSRHKTLEKFMNAVCRKAKLPATAWKGAECEVIRTEWVSFVKDRERIRSVHAPEARRIAVEYIEEWLADTVAYLCANRQISGDITYLYDPIADSEVLDAPSLVRYSGCIYALSRALDTGHSFNRYGCASLADAMISAQLTRSSVIPDVGRVVVERKSSSPPKLGSTALLALALGGEALNLCYKTAYDELYRSVIAAHKPDGRFLTHFGVTTENRRSSEFSSGQALLVVAQAAARGDQMAMDIRLGAFEPYRNQFIAKPTTAFVGWHADLWTRLAPLTGRTDFAHFVFEQVDWLLMLQIADKNDSDRLGGFAKRGDAPTFSSIVYLEAVVRAYSMAQSMGDKHHIEKYKDAILLGLTFCSRLRLSQVPSTWFPSPSRSMGGVGLGLLDKRVRCDIPQHFITLCLAVLENAGSLMTLLHYS